MYMFLEKNYELKHTTANLTTVFRQLILFTTVSEEKGKKKKKKPFTLNEIK